MGYPEQEESVQDAQGPQLSHRCQSVYCHIAPAGRCQAPDHHLGSGQTQQHSHQGGDCG